MKYNVKWTQTLQEVFEVDADSKEEAIERVSNGEFGDVDNIVDNDYEVVTDEEKAELDTTPYSESAGYLMLITYNFSTDYVAIPCKTEDEAKSWLEKYLKEEVLTIRNESEYEPIVRRYDLTSEAELIYADSESEIDSDTDIAIYKVVEIGNGFNNPSFPYLEKYGDIDI